MDNFNNLVPKHSNKISDNIKKSCLYQYYQKNLNDCRLSEIIKANCSPFIPSDYIINFSLRCLYECYQKILNNSMMDLVQETISDINSDDALVVCLVALRQNRYDILEMLVSKNFNFNQMVNKENSYDDYNVLTFILKNKIANSLDLIKYLVNVGADISHNNYQLFITACEMQSKDIIKYLLEFNIPQDRLIIGIISSVNMNPVSQQIFEILQRFDGKDSTPQPDWEIIKMIISKGVDIKKISKHLHFCLAKIDVPSVKFFLDQGMELNGPMPLYFACARNNLELAEFYLNYGLPVDQQILNLVLRNNNIPLLRLFMTYDIDLSQIENPGKYDDLINEMEARGLDKNTLLNIILEIFENNKSDKVEKLGDLLRTATIYYNSE